MLIDICIGEIMVFNSISVILWRSVLLVEETRSTRSKPPTCHKSLINLIK